MNFQRDISKLLAQLVSINTCYPPGSSDKFCRFVKSYLKDSKLYTKVVGRNSAKANLVAQNFTGNKKSLVFNSHIDTISPPLADWNTPPYKLTKKGKYLYGLGSVNCKGSAAVQLYLAKNLKKLFPNLKENVAFTFVTDEENLGKDGSYFLREKKIINPHTLVLGAPTNNNFIVEERGVFWASVYINGKTAHAGEPHKGINAIEKINNIIMKLQQQYKKVIKKNDFKNQKSTINIGLIKGGQNVNVVPSSAYFQIDRRITQKETVQQSFNELKRFIQSIEPKAKVVLDTGTNGFSSNKNNSYLKSLFSSYQLVYRKNPKFLSCIGVSDGRYFSDDNINIINIGPGDGDEGHRANEKMLIADLSNYYKILYNFLANLQNK